jgi:hypothetical protein
MDEKTQLGEVNCVETKARPVTAFILSFIGGLIILVGSVISSFWYLAGSPYGGYGGMWGGMMGAWHGSMGGFELPYGYMAAFSLIGVVSGTIVTIGAVMLNSRPAEHTAWGAIILVFSIISFVGMGGFFMGAILGIIGGAFALSWRPR